MEDDGRLRGTDHNDGVDAADMHGFVELVDAVEHLERIAVVLFELLKVI